MSYTPSPVTVAGLGALAVLAYLAKTLGPHLLNHFTSPLRALPGPPGGHWFFGHFVLLRGKEDSVVQEQWMEEYGPVLAFTGLFRAYRLWTVDTRAINHILTHSTNYQKAPSSRFHLSRMIGPGLLVAEDEQHRQQRRITNPAFGYAQVRDLTEIFVNESQKLRDVWQSQINDTNSGQLRLDVLSWLNRATLDIIGLAGFGYEFNSITGQRSELSDALSVLFDSTVAPSLLLILQAFIPPFRLFHTTRSRAAAAAQGTMRRIGMQLIASKKASILRDNQSKVVEKKDLQGRDLLTLLIKANMASDIPDNQRLSDEEVLAQVPTFMVAGHETTASSTMWTLYALAQHADIQSRLRDELLAFQSENPTMEDLQSFSYLDKVVKEVLRFYAPVPGTARIATQDDIIPLNTPFTDRNGVVHDSIRISKGDAVNIPIKTMNRYKPIWGEDAMEFRPERWDDPPDTSNSIPGVWSHLMSFLGGPRACIGYRFSLIEMKALLFTLIRSFEFELAVPIERVSMNTIIVQRPMILGDNGVKTNEMPLLVKPYVRL